MQRGSFHSTSDLLHFTYSSVPFQHPEYLIRFLLFLTYANSTKLGYDPTVKLVRLDDRIAWDYTIGEKRYRTQGHPLSENNAYYLISRGVRVWQVKELDKNDREIGEMKVIKDYWLYEDIPTEKEMQTRVLKSLEEVDKDRKTKYREEFKEFLVTIELDITVQIDGEDDLTRDKPADARSYHIPPLADEEHPKATMTPISHRYSSRPTPHHTALQDPNDNAMLRLHRRKHQRLLMRERCNTFYEFRDFRHVGRAIQQYTRGKPSCYFT